jgi:hypothetical protein
VGKISIPSPVKPIFGVLYREPAFYEEALRKIESNLSPVEFQSEAFPFVETDYYDEEMGSGLTRRYLALRDLVDPTELIHLKQLSNLWEEQSAAAGRRRINLDPGYLSLSKLVLASTKDFSHRLYLGRGIFAEVTLRYENGDFTRLPWTYPDYFNHREVLLSLRKLYHAQLRQETSAPADSAATGPA